ncbi:protein-(glutamine-N5) methyltransferase, release factor-specific [Streptomyces griseoflavus Tu4000]|uniref:Protein-(Glutamine-N5) methyltransferase, release factor-specific n=1 Tax=Streptomyces griseoflavus Tu4000 TaxID=467200 RepID=D9XW61_9ACTN|nr:protein-(glutamine-N5) methyltransferase, release factor-specific [Streptomyces griseoflavus Tu4000]
MPHTPSQSSPPSPPSAPSAPASREAVVSALRAAGCVFAEDEAELILAAAPTPDDVAPMVERRAAGLPLELVVGWAEFHGRRITVEPGVFVPRRRTEFLVEQALARVPGATLLVDLCCGPAPSARRWPRHSAGSSCTPPTSDPAAGRCARPQWPSECGGKVQQPVTCSAALPGKAARAGIDDPRGHWARNCPGGLIVLLAPGAATTSRAPRSTAARTVSTCCAGSPRRRRTGWRRAAASWWRPAAARPPPPSTPSPPPACAPTWPPPRTTTPTWSSASHRSPDRPTD